MFTRWVIFILIVVIVYFWTILPMTGNIAFLICMIFGLDAEYAVKLAFAFWTGFIVWAAIKA